VLILLLHLMNAIQRFAALSTIALSCAAASCYGDLFDFSYVFGPGSLGSGTVATGVFDGTANGDLINNISNVALFIDGSSLGPIFHSENFEGTGPAVVSFDGAQNDFVFAGLTGGLVLSVTGPSTNNAIVALNFVTDNIIAAGTIDPGNWSVVDLSTSSVPDRGATITMLGLGIASLACVTRWRSRAGRILSAA
jgi:hypothetical protein